jgi:hypothetical protein
MGFSLKKIFKAGGKLLTGDILGAAGTVIGAVAGSKGSKKAAKASAAAQQAAAQEQRNALTRVGQYQKPYLDAGSPAVNALMRVNAGDYSGFEGSPDFLAAQKFGTQAVERSAAARGGLNSGNTLTALTRFGQDNATQYLDNYRRALTTQAGIGQSAANNLGNATLGVAGGVGNALIGAGDARASGIVGSTNAITGAVEDLAGQAGDYIGNKLLKKPKAPKINVRNIGPY